MEYRLVPGVLVHGLLAKAGVVQGRVEKTGDDDACQCMCDHTIVVVADILLVPDKTALEGLMGGVAVDTVRGDLG